VWVTAGCSALAAANEVNRCCSLLIVASPGGLKTRWAGVVQVGQSGLATTSAIGLLKSNGPQSEQRKE
jgi:hypothetical protein